MLQEMVEAIAAEVSPERVYLFGSYAQGSTTIDSDVDLMVVQFRSCKPTVTHSAKELVILGMGTNPKPEKAIR
ncbi:MAG: nucleotidyltransferase domain-containing protein [Candidatus Hydrogenedentes bacterium]|nr:nucleotidyltransferase domain-containing protein [Candidatus Hydrogenedentota bacterium]